MDKTLSTFYKAKKWNEVEFLTESDYIVIGNNIKKILCWFNESVKCLGNNELNIKVIFHNGETNVYNELIDYDVKIKKESVSIYWAHGGIKKDSTDKEVQEIVRSEQWLAYSLLENWQQIKADILRAITQYKQDIDKAKFLKDFKA